MKIKKIAALLLAVLTVAGCSQASSESENTIVKSKRYIGQARGFMVSFEEFPQSDSVAGQQAELDRMVELASSSKLNTIFFEARQGASAYYSSKSFALDTAIAKGEKEKFDPLDYLCSKAGNSKVQVLAVIDPLAGGNLPEGTKDPFEGIAATAGRLDPADKSLQKLISTDAAELVKKYDVAGVLLSGLDNSCDSLVRAVSTAMSKSSPTAVLGISTNPMSGDNPMTVATAEKLATDGVVGMVMPVLRSEQGGTVDDESDKGYVAVMEQWAAATLGTADLYTLNSYHTENDNELDNQLLANAMNGKVSGAVLAPYSYLLGIGADERENLVSLLAAGKTPYHPTDLSISPTLSVTYPNSGISVTDKAIWVMVSSDPDKPLKLGDQEVERPSGKGTFGTLIELEMGENSFTFSQGEQSTTVKVNRIAAPTPVPISKITEGSLFPTGAFGVDSNETFEISVIGPATASITATLNGETVVMTQAAATQTKGLPATFKGSFTMNPASFASDKVSNIGKITYVVGYDGNHEVQKSSGDVYVAGKSVPLVVEVVEGRYVASVLTDVSHEDNFTQSIKSGARANVVSKTRTTRSGNPEVAYKLANGGYVMASKVKIVEDSSMLYSDITAITRESGDDWESYTLTGGQPAVLTDLQAGKLTLRLLDTKMTADPVVAMTGDIIKTVTRTDTKDGVELLLEFPVGGLWGHDITYSDNKTTIYFRKPPKLSETYGKPLEGVRIMLDPGHGGEDPGAMGVAGKLGPTEAVLNMAFANAAKLRLEQMGAEVLLTRADESRRVSLDERTYMAEADKPHIFIAIHHNSIALVQDISNLKRMEAYYWESIAKPLADSLMTSIGGTMGRETSASENAYYYVTRLTFAPAVLFELGYIVNPIQYEDCVRMSSLCSAANGIAEAVVKTLSLPAAPQPPETDNTQNSSAVS